MIQSKLLGLYLLLLLCIAMAAGVSQAREGDAYTLLEDSNLRQGPDNIYASSSRAVKGAQAIELNSSGVWKKVRIFDNGDAGWLYSASLVPVAEHVESLKMLKNSVNRLPVEVQTVLDIDDQLPLTENKFDSYSQSADTHAVDEMKVTLPEPKSVVQNMTPSKNNVDGEAVSPMFEDGAVSSTPTEATVVNASEQVAVEPPSVQLMSRDLDRKSQSTSTEAVLETVESDADASKGESVTDLRQFNKKTNLRAGPGRNFDTVSWAGVGSKAKEFERRGKWVHLQMQVSKRMGWVYESSLKSLLVKKVAEPELETVINAMDKDISSQSEQPVSSQKTVAQNNVNVEAVAQVQSVENSISPPVVVPGADVDVKKIALGTVAQDAKPLSGQLSSDSSQLVMQTAMIRVGPSALSEVLGWVGAGAQIKPLDQQGKWIKVRLLDSDRIGWVEAVSLVGAKAPTASMTMLGLPEKQIQHGTSQQLDTTHSIQAGLETADHASDGAVSDQAKTEVKSIENPVVDSVVTGKVIHAFNKNASVRAGPGPKFDTVTWAEAGAQAVELNRQGDWVRIQMQVSKRIGWVYDRSLELVSAAGVVAATTATAVAPIVLPVVDLSLPDPSSDQQANTVKPVDVSVETKDDQFSVINNLYRFNKRTNLRSGPAIKYDVVSWVGQGDFAIEQMRQSDWVRVQMQANKRIGWVYKDSLELVDTTTNVNVNPDDTPKAASETVNLSDHGIYFFKQTSNLRAGPGKEFDRIGWGGRNESAEELERQGDWQRIRLAMSGETGWVFSSYLVRAVHTGYIMGVPRSVLSPTVTSRATKSVENSGGMYEVTRTEPLRAEAEDYADLIGSVQKGDVVAWLEERNGWVRVNPQINGSKIGWLDGKLLKQQSQLKRNVKRKKLLISHDNVNTYKERISKGETFNFSYAALEEALYRIPVEDIHIRIGKEDLKALFLKRQYDQSPFEIRLTTGRYRLKGTVKVLGSSTRVFKKKSIMIKLDKQSARWYGHRRMALRSMASDKALMREWMTWKMMAALGMKVPEVHFTRVSFNKGEKTALYLSIEWMGSEFLEGNGLDTHGEFYQPNDGAHCGDLYTPDSVELCFDKITPFGDYSNLKSMAKSVNEATNENIDQVLAKYFEDESIINWIAVNALVTNGDTYNKNYWLYYHPTREKWTVVPWDYNLTYGRTYDLYSTKKFRIFNDNFQYYYPPDVGAGNPIKDKALRNPKLRKRLEDKIKHLIGMEPHGSEHTFGWFSPTVMHARIGNLAAALGKEVDKDSFLSYDESDFTKTYESLMHYVDAHDHFLKVKLFGDFPWGPEPPNQPLTFMPLPEMLIGEGEIKAGAESLHMVDRGWGYFVAHLNLNEPLKSKADFEVKIEGGIKPKLLPAAIQSASRCIERSWLLQTFTEDVSVTGDLKVEYIQENSRRSEVPPNVHEEMLELWVLDGHRWEPVQTEVNEYSNTLTAKNIDVKSGHQYRFVACSPF